MAVVVIGGQASGAGKTGLICGLIRAMPERRWTAIKITQCSHQSGETVCDCELQGLEFAIKEETCGANPPKRSLSGAPVLADTARYLAAGAVRSLWVRTLPGHLSEAMPRVEEEIARAGNVAIESNSVMEFVRPDVYAMVVSADAGDFKSTALKYLDRADAIVMAARSYEGKSMDALRGRATSVPWFSMDAQMVSPELIAFVRSRIGMKR